jgi:serine-type D-Ala-D-Ala carboxypeptidase
VSDFSEARGVVAAAILARAFPAAVVEVGTSAEVLWREAAGALTYEPDAAAVSDRTVFDLASLTKIVATATIAMRQIDAGSLTLDDRISRWLLRWRGADCERATVSDLLAHSSGLPAYLPLYRDHAGRQAFESAICATPLEFAPGTRSIYSDLGFMLLGFALETSAGRALPSQFAAVAGELGLESMAFPPPPNWHREIAPTELDAWRGRLLVGEVHDENAAALGGAAGHAGLFGSVEDVGRFARAVLQTLSGTPRLATPETMRRFVRRTTVPGSSRALAWDTMLPTSSCGTRMSPAAIGHTGFTGTSLWIDPSSDVYVVLLTNRVYPARGNDAIQPVRREFHDAVMKTVAARARRTV